MTVVESAEASEVYKRQVLGAPSDTGGVFVCTALFERKLSTGKLVNYIKKGLFSAAEMVLRPQASGLLVSAYTVACLSRQNV